MTSAGRPGCKSAARRPSGPPGKPRRVAAGLPLSTLVRRALGRVRTWELARIGSNLNQLARWANTHTSALEAVTVIAHLTALSRELAAFSSPETEAEADDAH